MSAAGISRRRRLLVYSYPRGARREELFDTLAQCAAPRRVGPAVRETVDLLLHGMRARLGRPRSRGVVLLAVLVAVAGGLVGAAAGGRLAWESAPALPSGAEAAEISRTVFPGMTTWGGGDAPLFIGQGDGEGIQRGHALYWVRHTAATRDVVGFSTAARVRLATAGWDIRTDVAAHADPGSEPTAEQERNTRRFRATRDGLVLDFMNYYWPDRPSYDSDGAATFALMRAEPPAVPIGAVLGGLAGTVVAWLLAGWVSRRTEAAPGSGSVLACMTAIALVMLLPAVLQGWWLLQEADDPWAPLEPFWGGLLNPLLMLPVAIAVLLSVAMLGMAVIARPPAAPGPLRRAGRLVARRPRPAAAGLIGAVVAAAAAWYATPAWTCGPTGLPVEPDPADTRLSRQGRVYVNPESTFEQRNYIEAAINRTTGATAANFHWDPDSSEFHRVSCGGSGTVPYYFEVSLSSPGVLPAVAAETAGMPGVIAVHRDVDD